MHRRFPLRNGTDRAVRVLSVEADCAYVEVSFAPRRLEAGEAGWLDFRLDTRGNLGRFSKGVEILTDARPEPVALRVSGVVAHRPKGIPRPEAIFATGCRGCHLGGGIGKKSGGELYDALCYACHGEPAFGGGKPRAELRRRIEEGVEASFMPAFSGARGGPLDAAQISSLLRFLRAGGDSP